MRFWPKKKDNVMVITNDMKKADSYLGAVLNTVKNLSRRMSGGNLFGISPDGKRDYNKLFGYGENLNYYDYKGMYERGGYAGTIVDLFPKLCWRDMPEFKVNEKSVMEDEIKQLKRYGLFDGLERADRANRIGRYSVLFIGVPDGLAPNLPVGEAKNGNFKGLYFNIYEQNGIEILSKNDDPSSDRFGLPELYQLQVIPEEDDDLNVGYSSMVVHHSRVVHLAEGALASKLQGSSSLKKPWNALTDKEKVRGSSGESYYRNSRQKLALETNEGAKVSTDPEVKKALKENVEQFQNGFEDTLRLSNMKANMLQPSMIDPRGAFDVATEDAAGASRIPVRFLTTKAGGTVTGSEDKAALNAVVKDRQDQECTGWLFSSLEILDEAGILNLPEFMEIEWKPQPSLTELDASVVTKNKADAFNSVTTGLSTIGGDDVAVESVFNEVGLNGIDTDEINFSDDNTDKKSKV